GPAKPAGKSATPPPAEAKAKQPPAAAKTGNGAGAAKPAAAKPAAAKPGAPVAKPDAAKKAAAPVKASGAGSGRTKTRKLGQIFVDLGLIDENQLAELVEEIEVTGQRIGQAAVTRGWINEDHLAKALAEQFGFRVANLDEVHPQSEALTLVP